MENTNSDITQAITAYIESVQTITSEKFARDYPNLGTPTITASYGIKYARIITESGSSRSVHSFIDLKTGDVLKAESWKRPAKGVRSNLFDVNHGLGSVDSYGTR